MTRPAVFLDRDGTLIADRHYLADPDGVELLAGAGEAVARLNRAGLPAVLVTNQSGIGRGYFSEAQYRSVHERLVEELAAHGARLDAVYHCPLGPNDPDPQEMRKPGIGMYARAAAEHGLDLARSFYVGDRVRDVAAVERVGGTAILVRGPQSEEAPPYAVVVDTLAEAVEVIIIRVAGG